MRIAFGEIGRAKSRYIIPENSWQPIDEVVVLTPPVAEVVIQSKDDDTVVLEGNLAVTVELACSRCGEPVAFELNEDFLYLITTREEEVSELPDKECSEEECDTLYLKDPVIDVAEILREQMYLAVPGKALCKDTCRGLCPVCGAFLGSDKCSCSEFPQDSPFAVLKKLKKD
ncbi:MULTISPECIES: YceD family protein [Desulfosediminicola]|uniref:YceD family protein n=1 Tax=Desulfosediminicola TaxID=2886823 RepID=UPI0010AC983D|nr:DUF177 domain-containing protein [Desulfosediminicola ganghwensis]